MKRGTIVSWNNEKGYGFIRPEDGTADVFAHVSAFRHRSRVPTPSLQVSYSAQKDEKGRPRAKQVLFSGERARSSGPSMFPVAMVAVFFAVLGYLLHAGDIPAGLAGAYLLLSGASFLLYAADKSAAREGRWRVSESALLVSGLVGGWPGALLAQNRLRHKTRKLSFQLPFWLTVAMNCAALQWLTTDRGRHFLNLHELFR